MNTFRILFQYKDTNNQIQTNNVDIGLISDITNVFGISKSSAGIPTQPSQNAFVMDYGVTRTYKFSFRRISPHNNPEVDDDLTKDSTRWSNGFWVYVMKRFIVNRWQSETDGCKIRFDSVDSDNNPQEYLYPSIKPTNVYVSGFNPSQTMGDNTTLTGTLSFTVGATNISKTVAKHTIIYDANYGTQAKQKQSQAVGDDTNYVMVTNQPVANAIGLPPNWQSRAFNEYGISDTKFRWCTEKYPPAETPVYFKMGDQIVLEDESHNINIDTITLYAIYDIDDPPTQ